MVPKLKGPQLLYNGTVGSAAYDVQTPMAATMPPSETLVLDLSLSAAIPERYALQLSSAGVIDSEYRGSDIVQQQYKYIQDCQGQRITQVFLFPTYNVDWEEVEQLPSTSRGNGVLGLTGQV